jgi:IS4 transposase
LGQQGCLLGIKKTYNILKENELPDNRHQHILELITNQMTWTANTIGELYKSRWEVEIFFREIKQLLHIKSFICISQNAVMI